MSEVTPKQFINTAVSCYLDLIDHTNQFYEIIKNEAFLRTLLDLGVMNRKINFYIEILEELKGFKCEICNGTDVSYECPLVICESCHTEYVFNNDTSIDVCKDCPSYSIGTCKARSIIPEDNNERKTNLDPKELKTFQRISEHQQPNTDDPAER
jgi:hypothetical protein